MPTKEDIESLKKAFDTFDTQPAFCPDGQCDSDEDVDLQDYPSYTEALYAKLIAPYSSGIYISRWDIKDIALVAGDSMAIHPRKRMFELLMKFAVRKENMEAVLAALKTNMEDKVVIYEEFIRNYPNSAEVFEPKIDKARKTMKLFPQIITEYFE